MLALIPLLASVAPAAQQAPSSDPPPIDNFNRPDENPLSDGGKWTGLGGPALMVLNNQLTCSDGGSNCQAWRNDVRYGLDQEAWVTFATKPNDWMRLYARPRTDRRLVVDFVKKVSYYSRDHYATFSRMRWPNGA